MGDFDFLGDTSSSSPRRVYYRPQRQSSGCLPVIQVALGIILAVVLLFGGCVALVGVGVNEAAKDIKRNRGKGGDTFMDAVYDEVVSDSIEQYNTVVRGGGSEIEKSVQAGMVMAACAQAKDDAGYAKWKRIKDQHDRRAGLPVMR